MPFANIGAARDAILGWFNTQYTAAFPVTTRVGVTLAEPTYVAYPDTLPETPQDNESWVRLIWQTKLGFQATINSPGQRRFRSKGTLIVEIRTPKGDGLTTSDTLVNIVQDIFEGAQVPGEDAVIFREVSTPEPGTDGSWFLVKVLVNFEYDRMH